MLESKVAKIALVFCLLCVLAAGTTYISYRWCKSGLIEQLTIEAGETLPQASAFYAVAGTDVVYSADPAWISPDLPGDYLLSVRRWLFHYDVLLSIRDSRPPQGIAKPLDLLPGERAEAYDFATELTDETAIDLAFVNEPDFSHVGSQKIEILLTDRGGNQTILATTLRISPLRESLTFEATSQQTLPDPHSWLKDEADAFLVTWLEPQPVLNQLGEQQIRLDVDGTVCDSSIHIVDTSAPAGQAISLNAWIGDEINPEDFVGEIKDATDVTLQFADDPDFTQPGRQPVGLLLTDAAGNETVLQSFVVLTADEEAPVIYGAQKYTLYIGQTATYKKEVYALDNRDGEVSVTVDTSQVNPRVAGTYPAVYSATDQAGNETRVTFEVTVKPESVTLAELNELADEVLSQLIDDNMAEIDKAWEIYKYANTRVLYSPYSDKTDWMKEAKFGITQRYGDCFTYYSVARILLERAGFRVLSVERDKRPGESQHFWLMVSLDENWYHFDASIHRPFFESFMLTTGQLEEICEKTRQPHYYRFIKELYPETPTETIRDINLRGERQP